MKRVLYLALCAATSLFAAETPNILFIYADDMGWTGTSVEMIPGDSATKSDFYQTPNLERFAKRAVVFSQAYSPGPMCTPSRAAILTGKTPAETRVTTPGGGKSDGSRKVITPRPNTRLPDDAVTVGTMLKKQGYATALLGKWHVGRNDHAASYGFDLHDGSTENHDKGTDEDPKEIESLTRRGIAFMEKSARAGVPFYLQLSHYAVHGPSQSKPASIAKFDQLPAGDIHHATDYAGMTWDLDQSLAKLFQALERLNIADETYVVFMSDNGAMGNQRRRNNIPLNAGKGTLYEGGIRVPFMISGPGVAPGYRSEAVSGTDLFPTFAAWAGVEMSPGEGEDLSPLLTGRSNAFQRRNDLLFHYPHYGQGPQVPQSALIDGDWKLLKNWDDGTTALFNLRDDIGESDDLSEAQPKRHAELLAALEKRLSETKAQLPEVNPDYDPDSAPSRRGRSSRKRR